MPSTYAPQDAINLVSNYIHGVPTAAVQANACDVVNSLIWNFYPWGWAIQSLTATNLVQGVQTATVFGTQQDYTITGCWLTVPINLQVGGVTSANWGGGFIVDLATAATPGLTESSFTVTATMPSKYPHNLPVGGGSAAIGKVGTILGATVAGYNTSITITSIPNANTIVGTISNSGLANSGGGGNPSILRPLKMRISRQDTTPAEYRELALLGNLAPELSRTAGIDTMKAVGWFSSQNFFRFDVSPQVALGQIIQLSGEYQSYPTKITDSTLATPFAFPDQYYEVFVEGLKWKLYQLSDDPRAGGVSAVKNGGFTKQFTGQYANFYFALNEMARTEDLGAGDEFQWPEQPLGVGRSYWPGMYGI